MAKYENGGRRFALFSIMLIILFVATTSEAVTECKGKCLKSCRDKLPIASRKICLDDCLKKCKSSSLSDAL